MQKIISAGIIHFLALSYFAYRQYTQTPKLYAFFSSITSNNALHLLHTSFLIYLIFLTTKLLLRFTLGDIRTEEISSVNDNCFLFLTDVLLIITVFGDDLSVKNMIVFAVAISLKCINWIVMERIKYQIQKRTFVTISVTLLFSALLTFLALYSAVHKPSIYILYAFEFGIVFLASLRNIVFAVVHLEENDTTPQKTFILDISFLFLRLLCVLAFFVVTTINFRLPFNLFREALGNVRLLYKKVNQYIKYKKISSLLNLCEDAVVEDGHCPICFVDMEAGKKIGCGHVFHKECLKKWVETSDVCPMCRRPIFEGEEVIFTEGNEVITGVPIVVDE